MEDGLHGREGPSHIILSQQLIVVLHKVMFQGVPVWVEVCRHREAGSRCQGLPVNTY